MFLRVQNSSHAKSNSQGVIFVTVLFQRAPLLHTPFSFLGWNLESQRNQIDPP